MSEDKRLNDWVALGRVSGLFGVQGWLKIHSYTEPRANIVDYERWLVGADLGSSRRYQLEQGKPQGKGLVAKLLGVEDRDQAQSLVGETIWVKREELPACEPGEYYWADLEGLRVVNTAGVDLGSVDYLIATGANDVLVVAGDRQRLIPFVQGQTVSRVDLERGEIVVDWSADF